jgi:hypothetical protein
VRAQQDCIRRNDRAAQERRLARLRARRRCEDLSEFLGRLAFQPRDRDQTADLLRRSLVAARDMETLVIGARAAQPRRRRHQAITPATLTIPENLVELLDDAIRDGPLVDEPGDAARRLLVAPA